MLQPRKMPQQARAKQRVATILEVAERLLADEGYENFSTNRVAREAGINIASVYQYFPNKEALIYAINRKMLDDVIENCERYEVMMHDMHWRELFNLMDKKLATDEAHVKLVRALDYAVYTTPELMAMEREHAEWIARFYTRLLQHYGSSWPEHSLINSGRMMYNMSNISYYDLGHLSDQDQRETMMLSTDHLMRFVQRILTEPAPKS